MYFYLYSSVFLVAAKAVRAFDPGLLGRPTDQSLFDDDQALLSSDLTESAENHQSSAIENELWPLSSDNSISFTGENFGSSPNDFSIASVPFASADCSASENSIFSTIGKSRLRRLAQCDSSDNNGSPPKLSFPSVDNLDENLRETILRENPGLYNTLRLSQSNEDNNAACIIITVGILPVGVCSSVTVNDWLFRAARTFPWNWGTVVTCWDLSYVTPGMIELKFHPFVSIDSIWADWYCVSCLVPQEVLGCPIPEQEFACCKEISDVNGVLTGIECAFFIDMKGTWHNWG